MALFYRWDQLGSQRLTASKQKQDTGGPRPKVDSSRPNPNSATGGSCPARHAPSRDCSHGHAAMRSRGGAAPQPSERPRPGSPNSGPSPHLALETPREALHSPERGRPARVAAGARLLSAGRLWASHSFSKFRRQIFNSYLVYLSYILS